MQASGVLTVPSLPLGLRLENNTLIRPEDKIMINVHLWARTELLYSHYQGSNTTILRRLLIKLDLSSDEYPSHTAMLNLRSENLLIKIAQRSDVVSASNFMIKEERHAHHTAWSQLIHSSRDLPMQYKQSRRSPQFQESENGRARPKSGGPSCHHLDRPSRVPIAPTAGGLGGIGSLCGDRQTLVFCNQQMQRFWKRRNTQRKGVGCLCLSRPVDGASA